jgi:hypothetical protein
MFTTVPFLVLYVPLLVVVEWFMFRKVYRSSAEDKSISGLGVVGALVSEVSILKLIFLLLVGAFVAFLLTLLLGVSIDLLAVQ